MLLLPHTTERTFWRSARWWDTVISQLLFTISGILIRMETSQMYLKIWGPEQKNHKMIWYQKTKHLPSQTPKNRTFSFWEGGILNPKIWIQVPRCLKSPKNRHFKVLVLIGTHFSDKIKNAASPEISALPAISNNGEGGIWTLAPVTRPTPLAGAPLQPLEYFSG